MVIVLQYLRKNGICLQAVEKRSLTHFVSTKYRQNELHKQDLHQQDTKDELQRSDTDIAGPGQC